MPLCTTPPPRSVSGLHLGVSFVCVCVCVCVCPLVFTPPPPVVDHDALPCTYLGTIFLLEGRSTSGISQVYWSANRAIPSPRAGRAGLAPRHLSLSLSLSLVFRGAVPYTLDGQEAKGKLGMACTRPAARIGLKLAARRMRRSGYVCMCIGLARPSSLARRRGALFPSFVSFASSAPGVPFPPPCPFEIMSSCSKVLY